MKKIQFFLAALISMGWLTSCDKNGDNPTPDFSGKTVSRIVFSYNQDCSDRFEVNFNYDNENRVSSMSMAEYYSNETDQIQEARYSYEPGVVTAVVNITIIDEESGPVSGDVIKYKMDLDANGRATQIYCSELQEDDYTFGDYVATDRLTYDSEGRLIRKDYLDGGYHTEYIWSGGNLTADKFIRESETYEHKYFYSECLNNANIDLNSFINVKSEDYWYIRALNVFGSRSKNVILPVDPDDGQHYPSDPSACIVKSDEDGNLVSITYSTNDETTVIYVYYK